MLWVWLVAGAVALDLALLAFLIAFARKGRRLVKRLAAAPPADGLPQLPDAARAFAARAGAWEAGPRLIRLTQSCEMRFGEGQSWHAFEAESAMALTHPGFVWQARMKLGPLPLIGVIDAYAQGRGLLEARLLGFLPLARSSGGEADRAELMRYLAELPWAPDALLRNPALAWRQLSDEVLEVSAPTAAGPARVRFHLEGGDILRVEADDRPRAVDGGIRPTRWEATFADYREIGGRRIPAEGEAAWILPAARFAYWRGRITGLRLE